MSLMDKVQFIATNFSFAAPQNFIPALKLFPLPKSVSWFYLNLSNLLGKLVCENNC